MKNRIIYSTILLLWALSTSVQSQSIGLHFPDTTMVQGNTTMLPLIVDSSLSTLDVFAFNIEVNYDHRYLEVIEVQTAEMTQHIGELTINSVEEGRLLISAASQSALVGKGELCYIYFKAIKSTYRTNVDIGTSSILNEGSPTLVTSAGEVKINTAPSIRIEPNEFDLLIGESLQMWVYGDTLAPMVYNVVEPEVGTIDNQGLFTAIGAGSTKITVTDANNVTDDTNREIMVYATSLTASDDLKQWQGNTIDIPITIENVSGEALNSGSFELNFTSSILNFVELVTEGTLLENASVSHSLISETKVKVSFASAQNMADKDTLIYLRFDVSRENSGYSQLEFNNIIINEGIEGLGVDGRFTTINFLTVYVRSQKYELIAGETCPLQYSGGVLPYRFESSDTSIATVSDEGVILAHSGGLVNFTVIDSVGSQTTSNDFTIYDTYIDVADTLAPANSDFLLPIYIGDFPEGVSTSAFQIEFDIERPEFELMDVITEGSLTKGWAVSHSISDDIVKVSAASTKEINTGGILFFLRLKLSDEFSIGRTAYVSINKILLNEGRPSALGYNGEIKAIKAEDIMIADILTPRSGCMLSREEVITTRIKNNGHIDYHSGDKLYLSYYLNGEYEVNDTLILTEDFPMQTSIDFTFTQTGDFSLFNEYSLQVNIELAASRDADPNNNVYYTSINNSNPPALDLGGDIYMCMQEEVTITAPDGYTNYWWSTGDKGIQSVTVEETTTVWLRVETQEGCHLSDTIVITQHTNASSDTIPVSLCENDVYEFNDRILTESGFYTDTFVNITGCDSIITINLEVIALQTDTILATICEGEYYVFGEDTLRFTGEYTLEESEEMISCSKTLLFLETMSHDNKYDTLTLCEAQLPFDYEGHMIPQGTKTGIYIIEQSSPNNCNYDTYIDLTIIANGHTEVIDYGKICPGELIDNLARYDENYDTIVHLNRCGMDSIIIYRWDMKYPPTVRILGVDTALINTAMNYSCLLGEEYIHWYISDQDASMVYINDSTVQILFSTPKTYELILECMNSCNTYSDTMDIYVRSESSNISRTNNEKSIVLHPNPTKGIINITATYEIETLRIYNSLGKEMLYFRVDARQTQLNIENELASGLYFIEIIDKQNQKQITKLTVE